MRRFTKVCLWMIGICMVLGLLLGSVSWALGFRGWRAARWGDGYLEETYEKMEGDIRGLELHVQAGRILVEEGEAFAITARTEGKPLRSVVEDGIWKLAAEEKEYENGSFIGGFYVDNEGLYWKASLGEVHITVPAGVTLDEASVDVEGGSVEIQPIICRRMDVDLKAGSVEFRADVKEGLRAKCQAGEIRGALAGRRDDFQMDMECSVGSVTVDGSTWAGLFMDEEPDEENRPKELELSCEAGAIDLDFYEEES